MLALAAALATLWVLSMIDGWHWRDILLRAWLACFFTFAAVIALIDFGVIQTVPA